jgi:small-conductance mechanosensitive channel
MSEQNDFRDRLIAAQQFSPASRQEYERRLKSMLARQLTPLQRGIVALFVFLGMAVVVAIVWVLLVDTSTSIQYKYAVGVVGIVVLAITVVRALIAVTGRYNARLHSKIISYIAFFGFTIFMIAVIFLSSKGSYVYPVVVSLFGFIGVTAGLLMVAIQQSELNVHEKLLEIELKLAEMKETIEKEQNG